MKTMLKDARAKDLMQSKVITLQTSDPVEDAISTFEEYHISGAPVINAAGKLVGVLSAADVTRSEHVSQGRIESRPGDYYLADLDEDAEVSSFADKDDYSPDVLGRQTVSDWMTTDIIAVAPDTKLREVCEKMVSNNVHRVLVVKDEKVTGIVSSFDVVRYLASEL